MGRPITPLEVPGITILRMRSVRMPSAKPATRIACFCLCKCGRKFAAWKSHLKSGNTTSCGCLKGKRSRLRTLRNVLPDDPEVRRMYNRWCSMHSRCYCPTAVQYKDWGGRGIRVCEAWHKFDAFLRDVGLPPSPKHTLDRIDNDGHYEPGNVRWADQFTQQANRRKPKRGPVFETEEELLRYYGLE